MNKGILFVTIFLLGLFISGCTANLSKTGKAAESPIASPSTTPGGCGDGIIYSGELCDHGGNFPSLDCYGEVTYCGAECNEWVTEYCYDYCGDDNVDAEHEECDGNEYRVGFQNCLQLGYDGGTIACKSDCKVDDTGCTISAFPEPSLRPTPDDIPADPKDVDVGTPFCCKCFWWDTNDYISACAEQRCDNWLSAGTTQCEIEQKIRLEKGWKELNPDTVGGSSDSCPSTHRAIYKFEGHSTANDLDNFWKFCTETTNCENVIGDVPGCLTFNNLNAAMDMFESYDGPKNVVLYGNQWSCFGMEQWSMTTVMMSKAGTCSYEFPLCSHFDEMKYCPMQGQKAAACSNDPADPATIDEYRKCCCGDVYTSIVLGAWSEVPIGKPVFAAFPDEKCEPDCSEISAAPGYGDYIYLTSNEGCKTYRDGCQKLWGSDYIKKYKCTGGPYFAEDAHTKLSYSYEFIPCPDDRPICISSGMEDEEVPQCIAIDDPRAVAVSTASSEFEHITNSNSLAELSSNIEIWLNT